MTRMRTDFVSAQSAFYVVVILRCAPRRKPKQQAIPEQNPPTKTQTSAPHLLCSQRNRNMQGIVINNRHFPDVIFPFLKLK